MGWCFRAYVFYLFKDRKYGVTVLGARLAKLSRREIMASFVAVG